MKNGKKIWATLAALLLVLATLSTSLSAQYAPSGASYVAGERVAMNYAYGFGNVPGANIVQGNTSTGSTSVTVCPAVRALGDGRVITLFNTNAPIFFDFGTTTSDTVTPTAVSLIQPPLGQQGDQQCAVISGTFNNTHGASQMTSQVRSGTYGLQEAINDAGQTGGTVTVGADWLGTNAIINAAFVWPGVSIADKRFGTTRFWAPTPTGAAIAAPTTLTSQAACDATHQFCSDSTVAGSANWATAVFGCVTYVDIAGNESPCSATANFVPVASMAIDIGLPAAKAGAVGWIPYLSLANGTYAQGYQITPTATVCKLTTLETVVPACALTNTTYNQTGSTFGAGTLFTGGAQITGYPLNTSQHFPALGSTAMTATSLTPITNSSATYTYAPANRVGGCEISTANVINYAASGSSATTIPNAIATWTVPAGCFNAIGAEFRVSGKFTFTDGGDSATKVLVAWDAPLSDATTVPTTLCSIVDTATGTAAAYNGTWYCSVKTVTTGTTGTALVDGYANIKLAAGATTLVRDSTDIAVAPSAATVNYVAPARIVVYFIGTGATNNPGAQGLAAKLEFVN